MMRLQLQQSFWHHGSSIFRGLSEVHHLEYYDKYGSRTSSQEHNVYRAVFNGEFRYDQRQTPGRTRVGTQQGLLKLMYTCIGANSRGPSTSALKYNMCSCGETDSS